MSVRNGVNYTSTKVCCYISTVAQAALINLWPLFFVLLREDFGLNYVQLATLAGLNFVVQLAADFIFSGVADRFGFRPFIIAANVCIAAGFVLFACAPYFTTRPYPLFLAATVIFSLGGGLCEILISPCINAIPSDSKSGSMAFLHSSYAWGQALVILLTSLSLRIFGNGSWQIIVLCWAAVPLAVSVMAALAPMPSLIPAEKRQSAVSVLKSPMFALCFLVIFFGAGVECTMVQWASAFMERAAGLPKLAGDFGGVMAFACCLGVSRLCHGLFSKRLNLSKYMLFGAALGIICYPIVAISGNGWLCMIFCGLTGFASGMLWPGSLVLADEQFPTAGAWLFALMAVGGDSGAAICPWLSGLLADNAYKIPMLAQWGNAAGLSAEQLGLRCAVGFSTLYPILTVVFLIAIIKLQKAKRAATKDGD